MSILEGGIAQSYQEIIRRKKIPRVQKANIAMAISLQRGRTQNSRDSINGLTDRLAKTLFSGQIAREKLSKVSVMDKKAALRGLFLALRSWPSIIDMNQYLICNETEIPFIFSDNPVVTTNWFFKNRYEDYAALGMNASGLQILLPINPCLALYLHDQNVYQATHTSGRMVLSENNDVIAMNNTIFRNSSKCIYLPANFDEIWLEKICKGSKYDPKPELKRYWQSANGSYELTDRDEYQAPDEAGTELLMMRQPSPDYFIRFNGLRIRENPRVHNDGSIAGPVRDYAWQTIANRFSKAMPSNFSDDNEFWNYAQKQPEFEHIGSWFRRDARFVKNESKVAA